MLNNVNDVNINKIVVEPEDRKKVLIPLVKLCYGLNLRGPKFFAQWISMAFAFKKNKHSDDLLSINELDCEIQRLKKVIVFD